MQCCRVTDAVGEHASRAHLRTARGWVTGHQETREEPREQQRPPSLPWVHVRLRAAKELGVWDDLIRLQIVFGFCFGAGAAACIPLTRVAQRWADRSRNWNVQKLHGLS